MSDECWPVLGEQRSQDLLLSQTDKQWPDTALYALCVCAPLLPGARWARRIPQHPCGLKWLCLLDPKEQASQSLLSEEPGSRGGP